MGISFSFIAKSTPAILVLSGVLFMFLDQMAETAFGLAGPALIVLGILVTIVWAGFFKRF